MKLPAESSVSGQWLDKSKLKDGDTIKIVSEAKLEEGQNGQQLVAKVLVKDGDKEPKNLGINKPSKRALVEVYGDDTVNWVNKKFVVQVDKTIIGGKRGYALYLIPEGYEVGEDEGGFVVVHRKPFVAGDAPTVEYPQGDGDIDPKDIPFD